ncbi:hypothetical protein L1N85_04150 [Paenibacillus alkaliterrae]|uniref:hypothetical protein n=1 Tax=Paenibacillus alkaliterrae TaxID=320909 RepID=UPI001F2313BF|nr:hypothetical protein [Paenibacillus alkaliterrae]MCF2937625.1 hypothetical protein [Paenibacillus alkaliterrae]
MNLSDMLGYADIQQLSRIADVYRCECNGHSKNDLIQSILSTVSRKDVFEAQISSMKLEDLRFLNSLLFEARSSYSLEDLIARVQLSRFGEESAKVEVEPPKKSKRSKKNAETDNKPLSPREMIANFKHRGWLFNGFSGPSRYLFQVPNDLKTRFRETLAKRFAAELQYTDEPPVYRDEQLLIHDDVTQFLHYIYHNEVQLTADGSMYKRFTLQLLDRFGVQEELPAKGAWRFGYGKHFNHYPNRFSFIYDYCFSNQYINENQTSLTLSAAGEERLASKPAGEAEQIYRYWLKLYKGPVSNLLSLVHWMSALAEQWVTVESLRKVLVPYIKPYYYDDANTILEQRIMSMMVHLGLLRLGEHPLFGAVVRMTKAGRAIISGVSLDEQKQMTLK